MSHKKASSWYAVLSLALITLVGAGCTAAPTPEITTDTPATETETNTQAATNTAVDATQEAEPAQEASPSSETPSTNTTTTPPTEDSSVYADGTYSATGTYTSPGGKEELPVTLTLENDMIVAVSVETPTTNPTSQKFQTIFADNFTALVVGKSIDEVNLTKVSGSSLTPKGFNDAVTQIKAQAEI